MEVVILSFFCASFGAWFMSRHAYRFGLLDIPNDRSSHNLPTPRGGGIGILAAFIVSSLLLKLPAYYWLPGTILSLVSFFDDKLNLTPKTRLIFQFVTALAVAWFALLGSSSSTGLSPGTSYPLFKTIMLVLSLCIFMVGTANFYNFMDGINGIAGITGVVGFALLSAFAFLHASMSGLALSSACLSVACLGFLPLNMPRAQVFMGDVGSILLGFVFATYVVFMSKGLTDFLVLAGFLSTFYADPLTTLFIRRRDGERLSQAHRRHLYQLFANQKGVPHWRVSACYGAIQALIGSMLLVIRPYGLAAVTVLELALFYCWWMVMMRVRRMVEMA